MIDEPMVITFFVGMGVGSFLTIIILKCCC